MLGTEKVRPVVFAADQLEPFVRCIGDIGGDVGATARGPRRTCGRGEAVASASQEVRDQRERHEDLGRGSRDRGDEAARRDDVEDQVPEFVEAEIGKADQRHPRMTRDREPPDESAPRQHRDDRADRSVFGTVRAPEWVVVSTSVLLRRGAVGERVGPCAERRAEGRAAMGAPTRGESPPGVEVHARWSARVTCSLEVFRCRWSAAI